MSDLIPPAMIQPHPRNAGIYGEDDITELAERIAASQWIKPLVVTPQNVIISGHRRWRAALKLNTPLIPIERRAFESETEELEALLLENANREKTTVQKVREGEVWREIEAERAKARMTAGINQHSPSANLRYPDTGKTSEKVAEKVGMRARNYEKAAAVVAEADRLAAAGEAAEAQALLDLCNTSVNAAHSQTRKKKAKAERAAAPLPFVPARCTIEQGSDIAHIGDASIDLICTDPPYGISTYGGVTKVGDQIVTADFDGGDTWDSADPADFLETLAGWVGEWARVLKPGGAVVAFTDKALISHLWDMCRAAGLAPKNILVWAKTNPSPASLGRRNLISATEFMIWAVKPGAPWAFNEVDGWDRRNVITAPLCGGHERTDHPTQKPLKVLRSLIACFSHADQTVLDPFAGSGSTGAAALELDRHAYLIEQNPDYINLIRHRLAERSNP